jgi:hypothetical protein
MGKVASFLGNQANKVGKTVTSKPFLKGAGTFIAGEGMKLVGKGLDAGADLAAAKSAKDISIRNSQIAEQNAELALNEARENSVRELQIARERIATGVVSAAGGGVVSSVGTPLLRALDEAKKGKERSEAVLAEGVARSGQFKEQAGAELLEGKTVSRARKVSAVSTVLGSVSHAIGKKRGLEKTIEA